LNQCREKARTCLTLSSSSISSILQLIVNAEDKLDSRRTSYSLNTIRCLFVQDLLPIALENRSLINVQTHVCHRWLIYAIEFYMEYWIVCYSKNRQINLHVELDGHQQMFQCDQPMERLDHLMELALHRQENFNWQQFMMKNDQQM
jgi:hypothetical protein